MQSVSESVNDNYPIRFKYLQLNLSLRCSGIGAKTETGVEPCTIL